MKKMTKVLSLILSLVLVVTSITFSPAKADTAKAQSFKFPEFLYGNVELTSDFYYSDDYFKQSSYTYNAHLATLSCCAASAASGTTAKNSLGKINYAKATVNIKNLLTKSGFDSFYANKDYTQTPKMDSFGFAFAKKKIQVDGKDYTLIAVNFRNALYDREWINNFKVGDGPIHQGFKECGDKVAEQLKQYCKDNDITKNVKLWISGYSRGAGVANYLGYKYDDYHYIGDVSIDPNDVYVYTYCTPNMTNSASYKQSKFKNIFNTISPYDPVTKIVPEQWNWHRFGEDKSLPRVIDSGYAAKKKRAQAFYDLILKNSGVTADVVPGWKVTIDFSDITHSSIEQSGTRNVEELLDDVISILASYVGSADHLSELDALIKNAIDKYYEMTDEQKTELASYFIAQAQEKGIGNLIMDAVMGGDQFANLVIDSLNHVGITIEDIEETKAAINKAINIFVQAVVENMNVLPDDVVTIYKNALPIITNHSLVTVLAWLQSMDSNYKLDPVNPTPKPIPIIEVPGKAKITKAKRKSAKKVYVKLKKISSARGYQVAVYKSKKKAKKNKGALVKKTYTKTKFTIKSKKFKKKTLWVKARAYTIDGKTKIYGGWSKAKKVKKK